ncbi:MAG: isochorismate synthase [Chloroflexi bacterium]|nr:isochorismate synthase [Chloroflexota bacterium]
MATNLQHTRREPQLVSSTRPVAAVDPIEVFAAAAGEATRGLWLRPSSGEALVGTGRASTLTHDMAQAWRALVADAAIDGPVDPLLLGSLRFDAEATPTALWSGFGGAARMVLPERLWRIEPGAATLTTNRVTQPDWPSEDRALDPPRLGLSPEGWRTLVREVASGIKTGELGVRKVVLARTQQVRARAPLETVLRRLAATYPTCTIFAIGMGDACFVGATPERLVALHNGTATTMALAGSGPRGATPERDAQLAESLLHDPKERTEHAVVVEALREDLSPFSTRVIAHAEPRIHTLPNLHHLITPIRAQVRPGFGVLDLVTGLHPTPAVGGYPRANAMAVIREREELDRGWYAAPLGWVDARGQGEFVVGLRSALLRDGTATLFAGCGIVGDSDPETEYAELGWKLRPMLAAVGAEA